MPILEYIRISKDKKLLLLGIAEEERSRYTVGERFYLSIGSPRARDIISDSDLDLIKKEDERVRATRKALSLLSFADNNEKGLALKLIRSGFCRELAEGVAREMVNLGYIDESRQLRRLVLREANINLSGYSKFLPKLISKGFSAEDIREATRALVDEGEIDFKENAKRLIEKKLGSGATAEEKKKILYKNGYKI